MEYQIQGVYYRYPLGDWEDANDPITNFLENCGLVYRYIINNMEE